MGAAEKIMTRPVTRRVPISPRLAQSASARRRRPGLMMLMPQRNPAAAVKKKPPISGTPWGKMLVRR